MMDIYIQSEIGTCGEFFASGEKKREISIVISPLKIIGDEKNLKVISGCNMWQGCRNTSCHYSKGARATNPRINERASV